MTVALMYHDVVSRADADGVGFPGRLAGRYKLEPTDFEDHLDAIEGTGRAVGLVTGEEAGAPPVAMTFDDGGSSALAIAEYLERRGWRGHFFVTSGRIDTPGFVSGTEVVELVERGHVVGSHSHSHPTNIGRLGEAAISEEWTKSRHVLGDLVGYAPSHASIPGGFVTPAVVESVAASGYEVLMTSDPVLRVDSLDQLKIFGRYAIWSDTPSRTAAAYAARSLRARARLAVEWKAKRAAKVVSPRAYDVLRRWRAGTELL